MLLFARHCIWLSGMAFNALTDLIHGVKESTEFCQDALFVVWPA